jgi:hypothetical protein
MLIASQGSQLLKKQRGSGFYKGRETERRDVRNE